MIRFCNKNENRNPEDYLEKEYLILDENIWEHGRKIFKYFPNEIDKERMIPVYDDKHRLICFAWQDREADRELRMLDELIKNKCTNLVDFKDIYPEYDGVIIYGCNEAAYYIFQYLQQIGVSVSVEGWLWRKFGIEEHENILTDRKFPIYAEGIKRHRDVKQRESVSVEFECVDRIYEENIRIGKIRDSKGNMDDFLQKIRETQIAIIGTGVEAQNTYDFLLRNDIDIFCFVSKKKDKYHKYLYGKKIISDLEARTILKEPIFIDPKSRYSSWGFGEVDFYDYIGYKRNQSFFFIQDYIEIQRSGLQNILKHFIREKNGHLVLTGDIWLCCKLDYILEEQNAELCGKVVYSDVMGIYQNEEVDLKRIDENEIGQNDLCLLLIPEYYGNQDDSVKTGYIEERRKKYLRKLEELKLVNATEYFLDVEYMMSYENERADKNQHSAYQVGKLIIGAHNGFSGNSFFRGILDNHPNILMLDWSSFNNNLFLFCVRLAMEKSDHILPLFWKLCDEQKNAPDEIFKKDFPKKDVFNKNMLEMLKEKTIFTSQELFVMIHIAYAKMWGKKIDSLSKMIIYWEPHHVPRDLCEKYALWLHTVSSERYIVNVVRNSYASAGSFLKLLGRLSNSKSAFRCSRNLPIFSQVLGYPNEQKTDYEGWRRITLRFEDLKCNAKNELLSFCNTLGLPWSDTLLETTNHGVEFSLWGVSGFDLAPVYRTYEEFFSEFDRLRIILINAPWQKKYGYPYVNNSDFSRRELQEMFLKNFRFEKNDQSYDSIKNKKAVQKFITLNLLRNRREELMEKGK